MGFDIDRSFRQIEEARRAYFRRLQLELSKRSCEGSSVKNFDRQPDGEGSLIATIVAVLDRDDKLRHDYLQRRWQGLTGSR